jgi:hypothetical protein
MTSTCIGEPISWLSLERHHLRELDGAAQARVEEHLRACDACRSCMAQIEAPLELPVLPARSAQPGLVESLRRWMSTRWVLPVMAAAGAAIALLVLRPVTPGLEPPRAARLRIKGGELALDLVREHAGSIANDPLRFALGDRFKVLLTCPPGQLVHADVVVFQAGQAFFPLVATRVERCGNELPLPGAFTLDGDEPAIVCAVVSESSAIDRDSLSPGSLPKLSVCQTISPVP